MRPRTFLYMLWHLWLSFALVTALSNGFKFDASRKHSGMIETLHADVSIHELYS